MTASTAGDPAPVEVQVARLTDLDRLTDLAVAFYAEDGFSTPRDALVGNLSHLIGSSEARVALVTDPSDAPIAFGVTTTSFGLENGHIAELEDLYVAPTNRRSGVGAALVEDAAAWANARGCTQIEVVIAPNGQDVEHLHRYYEARGFADEGRRLRTRILTPPA